MWSHLAHGTPNCGDTHSKQAGGARFACVKRWCPIGEATSSARGRQIHKIFEQSTPRLQCSPWRGRRSSHLSGQRFLSHASSTRISPCVWLIRDVRCVVFASKDPNPETQSGTTAEWSPVIQPAASGVRVGIMGVGVLGRPAVSAPAGQLRWPDRLGQSLRRTISPCSPDRTNCRISERTDIPCEPATEHCGNQRLNR